MKKIMDATEKQFLNFLFEVETPGSSVATAMPAFQIVATIELDDNTLGGLTADGRFFETTLRSKSGFATAFATAVTDLEQAARTSTPAHVTRDFPVNFRDFERMRLDRIFSALTRKQINEQFRNAA